MYILRCSDGSYYVGSTNNLELRLAQHQAGEGANYTKKRLPVELVYYEEYERIDEAFYREKQVQGWRREKKEALIRGEHEKLPKLAMAYNKNMISAVSVVSTGSTTDPLRWLSSSKPPTKDSQPASESPLQQGQRPHTRRPFSSISEPAQEVGPLSVAELVEATDKELVEATGIKAFVGNISLLKIPKTAFLCSRNIPASAVLKCYDWAIEQREKGNCVISGFHSQLEKDVLHYLLKGNQPIIIALARGLKEKIESKLIKPLEEGRILIISPFDRTVKRVTEKTAEIRNKLMIELADIITVGYVSEGGNLERLLKTTEKEIISLV